MWVIKIGPVFFLCHEYFVRLCINEIGKWTYITTYAQ